MDKFQRTSNNSLQYIGGKNSITMNIYDELQKENQYPDVKADVIEISKNTVTITFD